MGTIFVVRHGETEYNREGLLQGPRIDSELTDRGRMQARAVAEALQPTPLDAIFSSPLKRAWHTALEIVAVLEEQGTSRETLAIQKVPELYEMDYGDFSGAAIEENRQELEQVLDAWRMGFVDQAFPGGESALLAQTRIRPFMQRLLERAEEETVLVVAHGRINRILLASLLGRGLQHLDEFPQSNASISELVVKGGRAEAVRVNDQDHLDLGGEESFS